MRNSSANGFGPEIRFTQSRCVTVCTHTFRRADPKETGGMRLGVNNVGRNFCNGYVACILSPLIIRCNIVIFPQE